MKLETGKPEHAVMNLNYIIRYGV